MNITKFNLNGNQLKIIALFAMLCDHIGVELFPQVSVLRYVGRLALPIFAFMIAEGCEYTHDRLKYFLRIAVLGVGCQAVYFIAEKSWYQGILITFSLSLIVIFSVDFCKRKKDFRSFVLAVFAVSAVIFVSGILPQLVKGLGYKVDYGLLGVLLPVVSYFPKKRTVKLICATVICLLLAVELGTFQLWSLTAVPLLYLYNGSRGKINLKYLFYIFYPSHLVAVYLIKMLFF